MITTGGTLDSVTWVETDLQAVEDHPVEADHLLGHDLLAEGGHRLVTDLHFGVDRRSVGVVVAVAGTARFFSSILCCVVAPPCF